MVVVMKAPIPGGIFWCFEFKERLSGAGEKEPMETLPQGIFQAILIFFGDLSRMVVVIKRPIPAVYCNVFGVLSSKKDFLVLVLVPTNYNILCLISFQWWW